MRNTWESHWISYRLSLTRTLIFVVYMGPEKMSGLAFKTFAEQFTCKAARAKWNSLASSSMWMRTVRFSIYSRPQYRCLLSWLQQRCWRRLFRCLSRWFLCALLPLTLRSTSSWRFDGNLRCCFTRPAGCSSCLSPAALQSYRGMRLKSLLTPRFFAHSSTKRNDSHRLIPWIWIAWSNGSAHRASS